MDQANLGKPVFKAPSENNINNSDDDEEHDDERRLSLGTIAAMKVMAGRARRRSLFDFDRAEVDIGKSTLSHADFPTTPDIKERASSFDGENTNELGFDRVMIYGILEQEMNKKLTGKYYEHAQCDITARQIANAVKDRIAALSIKNFKIVCVCYITKRAHPSMKLESGCAWDEFIATVEKDNFVDCVFQNEFISAVASVYGVCCQRVPQKPTKRSSSFPKSRAAQVFDAKFKRQ